MTTDPFSTASIESVVAESESKFIATLDLTRKENGETTKISLPIIEKDGTWKLFLNGQETMSTAAQKISDLQNKNKSIIAPLASTLLGSYDDTIVGTGNSFYSNQFNMTQTSLGITGWQQVPGVSVDSTMRYSVVYKGFFSDDTIGEIFHTGFNGWNGAAFYETISVGALNAPQGVYLKISNPSAAHAVRVRGHIYGN
ncbi:hypothetical protein [Paenibacillus borealis]|uniref:Uncharacterized protein n=1 Tax=Paenibacillus borealis TaxID=160799 RepID=A0A089MUE7_PAEBO|nr:hypothetical protein [Paenibacillus borealis]AIQ60089.1 hypothetical protein PBOR_26415 [Paenibacillus borealis]